VKLAIVGADLMDRSRITGAIRDVEVVEAVDADVVVVDLARALDSVAQLRAANPDARLVCYGPHVDEAAADAARAAGADVVLPRSKFFSDVAQMVGQG
jgi:hypothetical protein